MRQIIDLTAAPNVSGRPAHRASKRKQLVQSALDGEDDITRRPLDSQEKCPLPIVQETGCTLWPV